METWKSSESPFLSWSSSQLPLTVGAILRDGRGHTPPEHSIRDWSALDLPSSNYTMRIF